MAKLVEKNGQLGIMITHVNEEGIKKRTILSLRKIAVAIGLTIGIGAMGFSLGKNAVDNYYEDKKIETLANLEEDEKFVENELTNYSIAITEYNNIKMEENHSELEEIEKRVELVSKIRNLQKTAYELMKTKIAESLNIEKENYKIEISRMIADKHSKTTDIIKVSDINDEVIFYSENVPIEISNILNAYEGIGTYSGNGENSNWEKAIYDFIEEGNNLQNAIINLVNQNYTIEDGKLKSIDSTKGM